VSNAIPTSALIHAAGLTFKPRMDMISPRFSGLGGAGGNRTLRVGGGQPGDQVSFP